MPTLHKCEQKSAEWFDLRRGLLTASNVGKLRKPGTRQTLLWEMVAEMFTGETEEHFVSAPMLHGIQYEPVARSAYEIATGVETDSIGFISDWRFGCSPDFLVKEDCGGEIKCPNTKKFLQWKDSGGIPEEHLDQVIFSMLVSGRKSWDFVAFDPRLPAHMQLLIVPVKAEDYERETELLWNLAKVFISDVDAKYSRLQGGGE